MSLWQRLFGAPVPPAPIRESGLAQPQASYDGGVTITTAKQLEDYLKSGGQTASGETVTSDTAMRVGAVYACIRIIAGAVANMPLDIKRRVDDRIRNDATDHPLWSLMRRRPNRWQSPSEFKRMLQAHVLLEGNGYAHIVKSRGKILELLPLAPRRMKVKQADDLSLSYHYTRTNGATTSFEQAEILHLRGMTLDGVVGVSPITYAREAIGLAMTTEKHGARLFKNGTSLGLVLEHPGRLSSSLDTVAFLKESLEAYRGSENAGKSLILEEGMKVNDKVGMTSEDAQYLATRAFQRGDIFMFYGLPPHMAGDTEKSTSWGTGLEQQKDGFVTYTLEDWLTMWEEAVNRDLIRPDETDIYARFNRSSLVRGDIKTRWDQHVKSMQWGVHSPNEVRALEDENPRDGGDIYYPPPNTAGNSTKADAADLAEERQSNDNQNAS